MFLLSGSKSSKSCFIGLEEFQKGFLGYCIVCFYSIELWKWLLIMVMQSF